MSEHARKEHDPDLVMEALTMRPSVEADDALAAMSRGDWDEELDEENPRIDDPYFTDEELV